MNDPLEDQLRSTLRQAAQQTTTTHDIGLPSPSPRPSRSRRLVVTAALTAFALVGVGALVAARDDDPQTVQAAAGDTADGSGATPPATTMPSLRDAMNFLCANAKRFAPPPAANEPSKPSPGDLCDGIAGSNLTGSAYGACAASLRDLFGPLFESLAPQLDQLKAIYAEFEPRIRAITDDPATKAKIEAQLAPLRERLEALADPANRPDLSDPATRQQLFDELKADLEPLASDAELRAKVEAIASDLKVRLESLANSPEVQALGDKLKELAQSDQVKALGDKLAECLPR
jgi:hypothetical protein